MLQEVFAGHATAGFDPRVSSTAASLAIDAIIQKNRIVHWTKNTDVQNRMKGAIEDYLFDLKDQQGIDLTFAEIDRILEMLLDIARARYA